MDMLSRTIVGSNLDPSEQDGLRMCFTGLEKAGKTHFVSQAPDCYFIPVEVGYTGIDPNIARQPMITNWEELNWLVDEIIEQARAGNFTHPNIIFDSITTIEEYLHEAVLMADPKWKNHTKPKPKSLTMATTQGGYGEGYLIANNLFLKFLEKCDILAVELKINIIFTGHVIPCIMQDPLHGSYSTYELALHSPKNSKTIGKRELFTRWLDIMGFIYQPVHVYRPDDGAPLATMDDDTRMLGLSRAASYVAGCRLPITGEIELPMYNGWNHFAALVSEVSNINLWNDSLPESDS